MSFLLGTPVQMEVKEQPQGDLWFPIQYETIVARNFPRRLLQRRHHGLEVQALRAPEESGISEDTEVGPIRAS